MSITTLDSLDPHLQHSPEGLPRLENGDRLTSVEFERRFDAMPNLKKAELVEGVVYLGSPVRYDFHGNPHANLLGWLALYRATTGGVAIADNTTLRLDVDNVFQPDALMMFERNGQAHIDDQGYVAGAPEFVAEVAATTVSLDLNAKFHAYRRHAVREYLVWRTLERAIDWFVFRDGQFVRMPSDEHGHLRSEIFPGLWLDPAALIRDDLAAVLEFLRQGLSSPEHAAFVARMSPSA